MLTSVIVSKVEKANRYAHEPDRLTFNALGIEVRGDNDTHQVALADGRWHCSCHFFESHGSCVHVLTVQKILDHMLPKAAQTSLFEVLEAEANREPILPPA